MLSRRSILRALGFGAPAAAVVVAIEGAYAKELRAAADRAMAGYADATLTTKGAYPATLSLRDGAFTAERFNVGTLSAINAKLGNVTAGVITDKSGNFVLDMNSGVMSLHVDYNDEPLGLNISADDDTLDYCGDGWDYPDLDDPHYDDDYYSPAHS